MVSDLRKLVEACPAGFQALGESIPAAILALLDERDALQEELADADKLTKRLDAELAKLKAPPGIITTLDRVAEEILRARRKFPSREKRLAALVEEVGELAAAMLQRQGFARVRAEAIQVACCAVRIAEEGDADFDNPTWDSAP